MAPPTRGAFACATSASRKSRRFSPPLLRRSSVELEQAGQGYHARYLKVAPEPIAHEREFDSLSVTQIDKDPRVLAYNEVMRLMLHSSKFTGRGLGAHPLEARGVEPLELTLSRDATILHDRFAKEMAHLAGPGERYSAPSVTEVAKKTAERAIRFAGVLYTVDAFAAPLPQRNAGGPQLLGKTELRLLPYEIGVDVMERAIVLARWFLEEERRYYLALTQLPESKAESMLLDWLRRTIEGKTDSKWRPLEDTAKIGPGKSCEGWIFTKDDRVRAPRGMFPKEPGQKSTARGRDEDWVSMFDGHVVGHSAALLPARGEGRTRAESADPALCGPPGMSGFRAVPSGFRAVPSGFRAPQNGLQCVDITT